MNVCFSTEYIFLYVTGLAGAYTATLLVMINVMIGSGRAPLTLTSQGTFYPHDGMYARKQPLLLDKRLKRLSGQITSAWDYIILGYALIKFF
jgi:hypothetical protein